MMNKKQVFATVALITIAMTTIVYAQLLTGTITVRTGEVVDVFSSWNLGKNPAGAFASYGQIKDGNTFF